MADLEKSIAACCKQLKLSINFAGQAFEPKGNGSRAARGV